MKGEVGGITVARYLRLVTRLERGRGVMVQIFFDDNTGQITHTQLFLQEGDGSWGVPYPMEVANYGDSRIQDRR